MTKIYFLIFSIIFIQESDSVPSTSECGISRDCFRYPPDCVDGDCKFLYKWAEDGESVLFELNGKYEDYPTMDKIWLAIGFSNDMLMGNDSVAMCIYGVSGEPVQVVDTRYNGGRTRPGLLDSNNPQLGLSNITISVEGVFLTCKFRRQKSHPSNGFHDLRETWFILGAQGALNSTNNTIRKHKTMATGDVFVNFSQFKVQQ